MGDERLDRLFSLPPEEFTAARDQLVRELRGAGDREEAKRVSQLRRPTLAAWAVNQAVRADPDLLDSVLDAGAALRRALRRSLSGASRADVTGASRLRRQRVQEATERALGYLEDAGSDASTHRDDIAATFEAASADEAAGDRVAQAQLSRSLDPPSGFGELSPLAVAEPAEHASTDEHDEAEQEDARARAVAEARDRAQQASTIAVQSRDKAERADRDAGQADEEAKAAQARADRAQREAEHARQQADAQRRRAEKLQEEAAAARTTADRRARELRAAEQELEEG